MKILDEGWGFQVDDMNFLRHSNSTVLGYIKG